MKDLSVELFGTTLSNPIIPASGTFGFGYEFWDYYDIEMLGSIALKGTTLDERYGNPLPRIAECPSGMLNAIGLQNPGADKVANEELRKLALVYKKPVIVNIGGHSVQDYVQAVLPFNEKKRVLAIELNISCPNVKGGGMAFGLDPKVASDLVKEVKKVAKKPILVKLSPNVTDIAEMATAVVEAGADGLSLINTLVGMRFHLRTARPILSVGTGGYSGQGVFPVALRMVYQVAKAVNVPIVGMGGIASANDVLEMMYAGATAVMVGTENLRNPYACKQIIDSLPSVMDEYQIEKISDCTRRGHQ